MTKEDEDRIIRLIVKHVLKSQRNFLAFLKRKVRLAKRYEDTKQTGSRTDLV